MISRPYFVIFVIATITFLCVACHPSTEQTVEQNDVPNGEATPRDIEEYRELSAKFVPLGEMNIPEDNPMTEETIALGKTLFFDPRLSGNDKLSCVTCHSPELGYSDGQPLFSGFEGVEGPRRTPTIMNTGYYTAFFWDGRAESLEEQALGPISSPIEMNMDLDELVSKLNNIEGYPEMFATAFGEEITIDNMAKALAAFERTIVVDDTRFNQFLAGDYDAMTELEVDGMELFAGDARCISCHNGPNLSDNKFHNIGIESDDEGRKGITGFNGDDGVFRTPGLYGIGHHPPYMHDGSLATLEDVIDYYDRGGDDHPNRSPIIKELNLSDSEKEALLAFLNVLSGENSPQMDAPVLPGL